MIPWGVWPDSLSFLTSSRPIRPCLSGQHSWRMTLTTGLWPACRFAHTCTYTHEHIPPHKHTHKRNFRFKKLRLKHWTWKLFLQRWWVSWINRWPMCSHVKLEKVVWGFLLNNPVCTNKNTIVSDSWKDTTICDGCLRQWKNGTGI